MIKTGDQVTFVLECVDAEAANKLRHELLNSHMHPDQPCQGFVARVSANNGDVFERLDTANDILNDVAEYLSRQHLGDTEAEALLDRIEEE